MNDKYKLLGIWRVRVNCELKFAIKNIDWAFDFAVEMGMKWKKIITLARSMMVEQFGKTGWKIKGVTITNEKEE